MTSHERASLVLRRLMFPRMSPDTWEFHLTTRPGKYLVKMIADLAKEFDQHAEQVAGEAIAEFCLSSKVYGRETPDVTPPTERESTQAPFFHLYPHRDTSEDAEEPPEG